MAVVDTLLQKRPFKGEQIPELPEETGLRWLEEKEVAWLEHELLPKHHFHSVPPSEDEEVALSQTSHGGVPVFCNKKHGRPPIILLSHTTGRYHRSNACTEKEPRI